MLLRCNQATGKTTERVLAHLKLGFLTEQTKGQLLGLCALWLSHLILACMKTAQPDKSLINHCT